MERHSNYERKKLQIDKDLAKKYINDPNLKGTFLQWEAVRQHTPKGKNIEINVNSNLISINKYPNNLSSGSKGNPKKFN